MPILNWIALILSVHILSASVLRTGSQHTTLPSLQPALMLKRDLQHGPLNPEHGSPALVSETTASKNSHVDRDRDMYEELNPSHSVRRLANWIGLSSNATF